MTEHYAEPMDVYNIDMVHKLKKNIFRNYHIVIVWMSEHYAEPMDV
jgi:hypothetical protein